MARFDVGVTSVAALVCLAAPATGQYMVDGSNETRTIRCEPRAPIMISGNGNSLKILGECGTVTVGGTGNWLFIEATDRIDIEGRGNQVMWRRGIERARPVINNSGRDNNVTRAGRAEADALTKDPNVVSGGALAEGASPTDMTLAGRLMVQDIEKSRTVDCEGRPITVTARGSTLTFRGECPDLRINGSRNTIEIETAGIITAYGSDNQVTWLEGVGGRAPKVVDNGERNVIRRGKPRQ